MWQNQLFRRFFRCLLGRPFWSYWIGGFAFRFEHRKWNRGRNGLHQLGQPVAPSILFPAFKSEGEPGIVNAKFFFITRNLKSPAPPQFYRIASTSGENKIHYQSTWLKQSSRAGGQLPLLADPRPAVASPHPAVSHGQGGLPLPGVSHLLGRDTQGNRQLRHGSYEVGQIFHYLLL